MSKLHDLKEKRAKVVADARAFVESHAENGEVRALSAEDKATVDKFMNEASTLDDLITSLQSIEDVSEVEENSDDGSDPTPEQGVMVEKKSVRRSAPMPMIGARGERHGDVHASAEYRRVFRNWMRSGRVETRDVTVATATSGGNLVAPVQMSDDIVRQINNLTFIRGLAKITQVNSAQALGVRQMTSRLSAAAWTTEIQSIGSADSSLTTNRRDLTPNLLSKLVLVSLKMLEVMPDIEGFINEELAYQFAVAEENAYLNGTGSGQPLGIFTASASGIPTSQDYSTGNTTTGITADNLIGCKYQLKQPYLQGNKVAWVFSRAAVQQIRLLKDSQNRYIMADGGGLAAAPDTILGIPYHISEYCPNTFTTGLYVGALGNFDYYRVAELKDLWIQRLVELYAGTNEVGFAGRRFFDGSPVLGEAWVRVKLA